MRVLLVEPKTRYEEETTLETHYDYPHLGLLSIATNLETEGICVDYFATNAYKDPIAVLKKRLKKRYDFVGLSTISATIEHSFKIAELVKTTSLNTILIFGGIYAWLNPEEILKNQSVDFVI